jgi:membrane protein implicated in regulation of membrane protease activity
MKKSRLIFYLVFALFHLGAFIFTVVLDGNTGLLFQMVGWVPYFKWITFLGLALLVTDVVWSWITNKETQSEKSALAHELNTLKAKLFDLQEEAKQNQQAKLKP